jgi:plasmid stabilization system protein ParE
MDIVWSKPAREDLRLIHQYIASDSTHYATRVVEDIADKAELLALTPKLGRTVPEINEGNIREIGMYSYRIMYEISGETVFIHGVIHRRRNFKPETIKRK